MPFRRRFRRSGRKSLPGRKVWGGFDTFDIAGDFGTGELSPGEFVHHWILSPGDAADFYDEPTVIRFLFRWHATVEFATANLTNNYGAKLWLSIQTVKDDDPATPPFIEQIDSTKDYIWHDSVLFHHTNGGAIGYPSVSAFATPYLGVMDIRTKRKIPEGYGLSVQVWNMSNAQGLSSDYAEVPVIWHMSGRYLMIDH